MSRQDKRERRPAQTPEGRESQIISSAIDLAEKQILEGSASAQVITHFLKLGSSREKLEQERLRNENLLLSAKRETIQSAQRSEELFEKALEAMRKYSGQETEDDYDDD